MDLETRIGRIVTNSHGMRDAEPLPSDLPGLIRIVCIGDSVTFGYGVKGEEAFPNVLEALLQRTVPLDSHLKCNTEVYEEGLGGSFETEAFSGCGIEAPGEVVDVTGCVVGDVGFAGHISSE